MRPIAALFFAGLISLSAFQPVFARDEAPSSGLSLPSSLEDEHQELHAALARATRLKGRTGSAARALEAALMPHFMREEAFALPPLGLLPQVSSRKAPSDVARALAMTDELKRELPRMLSEHQTIVDKLEKLERTATREKQTAVVQFAHQLKAHARTEEQILYPTALLIGEVLRLKHTP